MLVLNYTKTSRRICPICGNTLDNTIETTKLSKNTKVEIKCSCCHSVFPSVYTTYERWMIRFPIILGAILGGIMTVCIIKFFTSVF